MAGSVVAVTASAEDWLIHWPCCMIKRLHCWRRYSNHLWHEWRPPPRIARAPARPGREDSPWVSRPPQRSLAQSSWHAAPPTASQTHGAAGCASLPSMRVVCQGVPLAGGELAVNAASAGSGTAARWYNAQCLNSGPVPLGLSKTRRRRTRAWRT